MGLTTADLVYHQTTRLCTLYGSRCLGRGAPCPGPSPWPTCHHSPEAQILAHSSVFSPCSTYAKNRAYTKARKGRSISPTTTPPKQLQVNRRDNLLPEQIESERVDRFAVGSLDTEPPARDTICMSSESGVFSDFFPPKPVGGRPTRTPGVAGAGVAASVLAEVSKALKPG